MNTVREIEKINERELELGIKVGQGSWHDEYADSAYVYMGKYEIYIQLLCVFLTAVCQVACRRISRKAMCLLSRRNSELL
jgi:hypothetical protein